MTWQDACTVTTANHLQFTQEDSNLRFSRLQRRQNKPSSTITESLICAGSHNCSCSAGLFLICDRCFPAKSKISKKPDRATYIQKSQPASHVMLHVIGDDICDNTNHSNGKPRLCQLFVVSLVRRRNICITPKYLLGQYHYF